MRLLLVNDDGPPGSVSPYLAPFVAALHQAGHSTVVVIPDRPLSWIGKAHFVSRPVSGRSYCPFHDLRAAGVVFSAPHHDNTALSRSATGRHTTATTGITPSSASTSAPRESGANSSGDTSAITCPVPNCSTTHIPTHHWLVVDGSPATCTQIGLFHHPRHSTAASLDEQPQPTSQSAFDLVISGPNHGHNASTIYSLSSGTVGAALEAALARYRAISFSFASKEPQPADLIMAAANRSVQLIELLMRDWHPDAELYSVNVPMVADVGDATACPVVFTVPARTHWAKGSLFTEAGGRWDTDPVTGEKTCVWSLERYFRWSPNMTDVEETARSAPEVEDLGALGKGCVSVTPMKAALEVIDLRCER